MTDETLSGKELEADDGFYYLPEDVKEFIEQGDKIFISKPYGDEKVSNEEYDYAVKKWEEFKKITGKKLCYTYNNSCYTVKKEVMNYDRKI